MKKYLISTLTAAAALSVPAFADGDGSQGSPYSGEIKDLDLSGWAANTTVYIDGWSSGYWANKNMTVVANINIGSGGISLTDGYSGDVYTFTGTITGSGNWTFTGASNNTPTQHYIFTGDLSGYSGSFSMTAGGTSNSEGYLQFGDGGKAATNTNVSGTGSITEATTGSGFAVIYNYGSLADDGGTAITIGNTSITTPDLQFTGSVNYIVSSALIGTGNNAKLTISNTGTTTLNGNVSGFSTITINSGSTLAVGSNVTLDLTGTTVNIGSTIQNSGTITMTSGTSLVVDTKGLTGSGSWSDGMTYTLITGTGTIDGYGSASISSNVYGATSVVSYDNNGTLTITFTDNAEATGLRGSGESDHAYYTTDSGSGISISNSIFTGAGTTVYLASSTQSLGNASENVYWNTSVNAECDIVIGAAGIYLTNGTSNNVHTFSGKISGSGNWSVAYYASGTGDSVSQHYIFTGDLSEWTGSFTITTVNTDDYVYFGNGGTAATNTSVSGASGSIAVDYGTVRYNYSGYADDTATSLTITNSSIEAHTVTFTGSVNYDVSSSLIGYDGASTATTNSTLTISTAGTVTVSGSVSNFDSIVVSEGSGLTVAASATVTLKEGSTLSVAEGGTLTLNTSIAADGATVSFSENASLVLTDAFLASAIATYDANDAVTITIITASAITYNGTELSDADALEGFASIVSTSDNYLLSNWTYSEGVLSASVTYLPEPSMFGLMCGLGAIGLVATRRRRRR